MKIMIVDDSEDMDLLIQSILQSAGYDDLVIAKSAYEAFNILGIDEHGMENNKGENSKDTTQKREEQHDVDLILMDIAMPGIDGIEACQIIHTSEKYSETPIIIVTARHEDDDLETAFYAGALYYVTKPLRRSELLARVHSSLRLKQEVDRCKAHKEELANAKREIKKLRAMLQDKTNGK